MRKRPVKKETTKIKEAMGKNTAAFIAGRRTRKDYLKRDDVLHKRLFEALKKRKKN